MPTFYIRLGEKQDKDALVSNLIGTLEKLYGIVTFDAIGVVLEAGDPAGDLLRSLAKDVIPERPTFSQLIGSGNTLELGGPYLVEEGTLPITSVKVEDLRPVLPSSQSTVVHVVEPGQEVLLDSATKVKAYETNTGPLYVGEPAQGEELSALEQALAKVSDKKRKCPRCGKTFTPASNRQMFCSKQCRIAAAAGQGNGARP